MNEPRRGWPTWRFHTCLQLGFQTQVCHHFLHLMELRSQSLPGDGGIIFNLCRNLGRRSLGHLGGKNHVIIPCVQLRPNQREGAHGASLASHWTRSRHGQNERIGACFSKVLDRRGNSLSQNGIAILATISSTHYLLSTSSKQRNKLRNTVFVFVVVPVPRTSICKWASYITLTNSPISSSASCHLAMPWPAQKRLAKTWVWVQSKVSCCDTLEKMESSMKEDGCTCQESQATSPSLV